MMVSLSNAKHHGWPGPRWPTQIRHGQPINRRSFQTAGVAALWAMQLSADTGRLLDATGISNGDLAGSTTWANHPVLGSVLAGDGNGWVNLTHVPITYPMTASVWFTTTADDVILMGWGNTTNDNVLVQIEMYLGKAYLAVRANTGSLDEISGGSGYNDGQAHHASAVFVSASSRQLFVDGVLVASSTTALNTLTTDNTTLGTRYQPGHSQEHIGNFVGLLGLSSIVRRAVGPAEQWQRFAAQSRWAMLQTRHTMRYFVMGSTTPSSPAFRRTLFGRAGSRGGIAC